MPDTGRDRMLGRVISAHYGLHTCANNGDVLNCGACAFDHYGEPRTQVPGSSLDDYLLMAGEREVLAEVVAEHQGCSSCASAPPYCGACLAEADAILAAGYRRGEVAK